MVIQMVTAFYTVPKLSLVTILEEPAKAKQTNKKSWTCSTNTFKQTKQIATPNVVTPTFSAIGKKTVCFAPKPCQK